MAVLQALIAFAGRSAGKILYAIFGWAVRALFGYTSGARRTLLTALVAMAAVWPLLLLGIAWPRVAALVLAFVPLPEGLPDAWIRSAWAALALCVPLVVGGVLASQAPRRGAVRESRSKRLARGFAITLGIAVAFWISFVSVPIARLVSWARGLRDAYVPLVTTPEGYADAAQRVFRVLDDHGFALEAREPGFWTRTPLRVLRALGGPALRGFVPERLAYFEGPALVVVLHPTGLLLRGTGDRTALAHGLAAEALFASGVHQTTDAEAQAIEREVRRVFAVYAENPHAHRGSARLLARACRLARDLTERDVPADDWQIVYRQILQLERALRGEPQLLARSDDDKGETMTIERPPLHGDRNADVPTAALLREIGGKVKLLARKELELARSELRSDFASELAAVKALGVAAMFAVATLNLLLVAAVFALTRYLDGWSAALLLAGVTLLATLIAAGIGMRRHVRKPLERTRRTLGEDVKWAEERLA